MMTPFRRDFILIVQNIKLDEVCTSLALAIVPNHATMAIICMVQKGNRMNLFQACF